MTSTCVSTPRKIRLNFVRCQFSSCFYANMEIPLKKSNICFQNHINAALFVQREFHVCIFGLSYKCLRLMMFNMYKFKKKNNEVLWQTFKRVEFTFRKQSSKTKSILLRIHRKILFKWKCIQENEYFRIYFAIFQTKQLFMNKIEIGFFDNIKWLTNLMQRWWCIQRLDVFFST